MQLKLRTLTDQQITAQQLMSAALRAAIKSLRASNMVRRQQVVVAQTPNANGQSRYPAMQAQPDQALP
jgi:hypothetical protein